MTVTSADVLSRHLKPLCSRDNHVMKYESGGSRANTGDRASYHCGIAGCSVRYSSTDGYYMLIRCPIHGRWLYRREDIEAQAGVRWLCGVEGCDYRYSANTKADWVRT